MTARLEVGVEYQSVGPVDAPTKVKVLEVDEADGFYRVEGQRLPSPFIKFGCEHLWRPVADPVLDVGAVPWWERRMVGFDLETTSPLPEEARIVTASIVVCGGGLASETLSLLADPGVEIPEGATAVHGITTEQARAEGLPAAEVVATLLDTLEIHLRDGMPLVVFNMRYDLTVLDREARRHGLVPLTERIPRLLGVDPFVIDKQLHRYRKGKRTLEAQCEHYRVKLDGAHDAAFDALAACRVAYRIGKSGEVIRRVRGREEARELAALKREWESVRYDLGALHEAQMRWACAERERFAAYKRSQGDHEDADRIESEVGWPVLDVMEHEEWAVADVA